MKKKHCFVVIALAFLLIVIPSCKEDEGFHQISQIEREIYLKINTFRTSQGLGSLVEQFLIFKEGRIISEKMAAGTYAPGDPKAQEDLDEITDNLGTANSLISLTSNLENADSIVNFLTTDPGSSEILKADFTQCGVGFSKGSDDLNYIAILLINIPDK